MPTIPGYICNLLVPIFSPPPVLPCTRVPLEIKTELIATQVVVDILNKAELQHPSKTFSGTSKCVLMTQLVIFIKIKV